jgi:hypothetical protein
VITAEATPEFEVGRGKNGVWQCFTTVKHCHTPCSQNESAWAVCVGWHVAGGVGRRGDDDSACLGVWGVQEQAGLNGVLYLFATS